VLFVGISLLYTKVIAPGGSHPIPWRDVTARLGPVVFPQQTISIIRTRGKLAKLLAIVTPKGDPVPKPPPLDFSRRLAILYAVGPRSSTGYDLRVVSVTEHGDRIQVVYRELTPGLADRVTPKLTFPYRLITLPKTGKPIRFKLEGRP
jgi:hypothetical protein